MNTNSIPGLTSIVIPCWNQLEFTRHCVAALTRHTRPAWEFILVDNGSTDDTAAYLAGVQDATAVPVTVVANSTNLGFPAAINQGLQLARGEYLVLLNNDVVVTDGWLDQLVALVNAKTQVTAEHSEIAHVKTDSENGNRTIIDFNEARAPAAGGPTIALAGPMSNYAAPPQLVESVPYHDLRGMHGFARRWRDEHRVQWFTVPRLSGFCLLMKRTVYDKIGGLDERFGIGFFDDDDLAERARRAGFELAVAHDLFIHHFGSRTFAGNGIDADKLLEENARRFAAKWGLPQISGKRVALRPFTDGGPPIVQEKAENGFEPQMNQMNTDQNATTLSIKRDHPPNRTNDLSNGSIPIVSPFSDLRSSAFICGQNIRSVNSALSAEKAMKVSLTMIVRDEEKNISACLQSVAGLFDEIVVVDTGSTDRTREIAREFGAKVFDFAWVDDFAAARNEALARATGDYAFWLDADDVVDPPERAKL
jgi:glycosyltransferase involved in cell wall biosynthesis